MKWEKGPTIGRGSAATVSLGRLSGEIVAVKSADLSASQSLQREQAIMSSLSCLHVVGYKGFDISIENSTVKYNIFLEYMPGGSLSEAIVANGGVLEELVIRTYTRQILIGLDYLHSKGLAHCDIKSSNILLGYSGAKIADFGCSKQAESCSSVEGTPMFMAPEVARGERQGSASDIWSLGCTVIEMASGGPPWKDVADPITVLYKVGYSGRIPELPRGLSKEGKDFIENCVRRNADDRWTAKELLSHPFLAGDGKVTVSSSPTAVLDESLRNYFDEPEWSCSVGNSTAVGARLALIDTLVNVGPTWDSDDEEWIAVR